jgi:hypothetical protein
MHACSPCISTRLNPQVAEAQYKRIVAEAESKFINVLTSDRAPHHRSLESSSKSQQYSKRLHRCVPCIRSLHSTSETFCSIDLSQARQCGLALPTAHTADADVIKLLQMPRSCQFSGDCALSCPYPSFAPFPLPLQTHTFLYLFGSHHKAVADVIASSNEISRTHQQFKIVSDDPVVLSLTSD